MMITFYRSMVKIIINVKNFLRVKSFKIHLGNNVRLVIG